MPTYGPFTPGTLAQETDATHEESDWVGGAVDVQTLDAVFASVTPWYGLPPPPPSMFTSLNAGYSAFLLLTNFGFAVPLGEVVTDVQVNISRKQTSPRAAGTDVQDRAIQLVVSGARTGDNKGLLATDWPDAVAAQSYSHAVGAGGWNLAGALSPAMVNAANFGVAIAVDGDGGPVAVPIVGDDVASAFIDLVTITLTTMPATIGGSGPFAIIPPYAYTVF